MITNNLKVFRPAADYNGKVMTACFGSGVTAVTMGLVSPTIAATWPFVVMSISLFILVTTLLLHNTNLYRFLNRTQIAAIQAYDALSPADQQRFEFSPRTVLALDMKEADDVTSAFEAVKATTDSLERETKKYQGLAFSINQTAKDLVAQRSKEIHSAREVNKEIDKMLREAH